MRPITLGIASGIVVAIAGGPAAQPAERVPAVRVDPIAAILDAFRTHAVVALGEGAHGNEQGHRFRLALVRNPRFPSVVNDIVVESGSARYQDVMDRFVGGADVPEHALRDLRENTVGAAPVWDRTMYGELYEAVREINRTRPRARQVRILLGDPPIDWATVTTAAQYRLWALQRDSHPAALIQREVLARGRRALVVYGDGHLQARSERPGRSLLGILEASGTSTFAVTTTFADLAAHQAGVDAWMTPAFASIKGTRLGAVPYERLFGPAPPVPYFRDHPLIEDHFDAVLYLGRTMTMSPLAYPRCAESGYVEMRVARMVLGGASPAIASRLAMECEAARTAAR